MPAPSDTDRRRRSDLLTQALAAVVITTLATAAAVTTELAASAALVSGDALVGLYAGAMGYIFGVGEGAFGRRHRNGNGA